jgi:hypothetical protein
MMQILRHGKFGATKNRGLIHVDPNVKQTIGSFEKIVRVEGCPVFSGFLIQEINPDTLARPTLTNKIL